MRAVRVHAFGEPPRVDAVAAPGPPDRGQLGIEVAAVGVGSWDLGMASGRLARFVKAAPPIVLGAELAGRVAAIGADVQGFSVGDRVIANPGLIGAWAERVNLRSSACGPAPVSLDDVHAAAVPVGGLSALQALRLLSLAPGGWLLILGAGGSVGRAAIQLASARGLSVSALVPAWELERSRELGASAALDQADDWVARLDGPVDGVLDLIGGEALERSRATLRAGGHMVTTLAETMRSRVASEVEMRYLRMRSTTADLAAVSAHIDAGELTLPVGTARPVGEVASALEELEVGHDGRKQVLVF
jgi:NADPH:quinone reductase-like Zn-dependent oxidoreductase